MHTSLRNLKIFIFLFFFSIIFNNFLHAHLRGTFSSEQEAFKRSLELGCKGVHKNKDKWLPCENEKELHKYLSQ